MAEPPDGSIPLPCRVSSTLTRLPAFSVLYVDRGMSESSIFHYLNFTHCRFRRFFGLPVLSKDEELQMFGWGACVTPLGQFFAPSSTGSPGCWESASSAGPACWWHADCTAPAAGSRPSAVTTQASWSFTLWLFSGPPCTQTQHLGGLGDGCTFSCKHGTLGGAVPAGACQRGRGGV